MDGLDTFTSVSLNGKTILTSDNMFIPHRVDITLAFKPGEENVLEMVFDSAFQRAREIKLAHPEHVWVGFNGDMSRLAVRKAQYHWCSTSLSNSYYYLLIGFQGVGTGALYFVLAGHGDQSD
jgi:beta-galactosidase/beta-glucuronidase